MSAVLLLCAGFGFSTQAHADIGVSISLTPPNTTFKDTINPGDVTSFQIVLTNNNTSGPVTNVNLNNSMPGFTVAGAGVTLYSCVSGDGVTTSHATSEVTAPLGAASIVLSGGTIPAAQTGGGLAGTCTINVQVTSVTQGSVTNTIAAGDVTGNDFTIGATSNPSPASQSITVNPLGKPVLSKSFSPSIVVTNDPNLVMTMGVTNNNAVSLPLNTAADSPAWGLHDLLPAGLTVAPSPQVAISCPGGTDPVVTAVAGSNEITAVGGVVAANASCTISVHLVAAPPTQPSTVFSRPIVNTISRTTDFGNKRGLVPTNDATASLTVNSILNVSKQFSPTTIAAGQESQLTISLRNDSPNTTITLDHFTDSPIDGAAGDRLLVNPAALQTNNCGSGVLTATTSNKGVLLTGGSILPNTTCILTIPFTGTLATPGVPQSFTNTIPAGAVVTTDANTVSTPATHSVTVVDQLLVTKTSVPNTVAPGALIQYKVSVSNYAHAQLTQVHIPDALPAGMSVLSSPTPPSVASTNGGNCGTLSNTGTATAPIFTLDTVDSGTGVSPTTCTITFWAMVSTDTSLTSVLNRIEAGAITTNGGGPGSPTNHSASLDAVAAVSANATVSKQFNPTSTSEGSVAQLTITLTNISGQPLTNASFTDNLPIGQVSGANASQMVIANPAGATTTCGNATITAVPGSSQLTFTGGTIPARQANGTGPYGTCTVQVKVVGAAGSYTNTLPQGALSATETYANGTTHTILSPGPVSALITYNSALGAGKSFFPTQIASGGKSTVKINLTNSSSGVLNGITVHDALPNNMVLATPVNARSTCAGTADFSASVVGTPSAPGVLDAKGMIVPAGGNCDVLVDVIGTGTGNWTNTIPPGGITAAGGVKTLSLISATLTNKTSGGVSVGVSVANSALLAPGETTVLTVTIHNIGDVDLDDVRLNNYFTAGGIAGAAPTGMVVASQPDFATTCTGGLVSAGTNNAGVNLSHAFVPGNSTCTITANVTMTTTGSVIDTIPPGAVLDSQGITNTGAVSTSLQAQANTGIFKSFTPAVIKPGQRSRLRLTFLNPNVIPLIHMAVTDTFPANLNVAGGGGNPSTTCADAVLTSTASSFSVSNGSMPAGTPTAPASCYAEIDVTSNTVGNYDNTIPIGGLQGDINGGSTHNASPTTATLQVLTPVTISKSFTPSNVKPGQRSVLAIQVTNPNATMLNGAALTDNLPANVVIAQVDFHSSVGTCGGSIAAQASGTSLTWTGGTIPASGSCTLNIDVVSNIAGSYTNTIPAGSLITQEGVTNEIPATAVLNLLDAPTVNKQFNPVSIPANGTSALTIVLGNTNGSVATLSHDMVDPLPISPGPILVATPNGLTNNTCPGTPIAAAGSASVTYPTNAKIPAGGCSFTINVTGAVQGSYNNFIPAGTLQTDIGNNPDPANANLVITPLGAISGRVFKENSVVQDGVFSTSGPIPDVGLANVVINLTSPRSNGPDGLPNTGDDIVNFSASTLTDALGNYSFTGLYSGTYTITEPNQPVGTLNGITTSGTGVQQPMTTPSAISSVTLTGTTSVSSSPNNNFAEVVTSSIAGNVFLDQNSNGTRELTDLPLEGVTVQLINTTTNVTLTTQTDATGAYVFNNVPPGNYTLKEPTQPANTINGITTPGTTANGGTAGTGSPASTPVSTITGIILPPGIASTGNNFAELASGRQVSGRVYMDANNNGVVDTGEVGIAGVTVVLTGQDVNGNPVPANTTAVTDANGRYIFMGLAEGTYTVTEPTQPPRSTNGITTAGPAGGTITALPSQIASIPLTGSTTVAIDNNFGEIPIPTGTVSGKVYIDTNNNGIIDSGEAGVNTGVTITLSGTKADNVTPFTATVQTLVDGSYSFTNVPPSNSTGYTITELQPPQYKDGKTTVAAGNPGTPASAKPVLANNIDVISSVVVIAGDVLPNYNFGEIPVIGAGIIPPIINGYVYLDKDHDHVRDNNGTSIGQPGWTVTLTNTTGGTPVNCVTTTDANGFYQFDNLHCAGFESTGLPIESGYKISFSKDGGTLTAVPTSGNNVGTIPAGGSVIDNITLHAGDQAIEQNLPLDPSGVIYDSSSRTPVAGAVIHITGPGGAPVDPAHLFGGHDTITVGSDGFYQFLLQDNGGADPFPDGTYTLAVTPPGGYRPAPSAVLPPCTGTLTIGAAPNPALIQSSNLAPGQSVPQANPAACVGAIPGGANTTQYYFSFVITHASADILNNHIPLDPMSSSQILVSKTTPLVNVSRGDLVPYTITATNTLSSPLANVAVRDQIPPGFKYRVGSASLNGAHLEPTVNGRVLTWPAQTFAAKEKKTYRLILQVGSGVGDGKYVNQGFALDFATSFMLSNLATATVNVVPDPTFDCPDVIGKVFDDKNANGYQDQGEPGIPAVRLATARGLLVMTDAEGRFHVPCPEIPNEDRGSNFVMKLDTRTLPSGYRITTENPRDIRLTRGKVSKLNFGATIHRVVRLELSDSAFQPNGEELKPEWQKQLDVLPKTLQERPSVVRLSYAPGNDNDDLVKKRIAAISKQIKGRWTALKGQYTLDIETEDAP